VLFINCARSQIGSQYEEANDSAATSEIPLSREDSRPLQAAARIWATGPEAASQAAGRTWVIAPAVARVAVGRIFLVAAPVSASRSPVGSRCRTSPATHLIRSACSGELAQSYLHFTHQKGSHRMTGSRLTTLFISLASMSMAFAQVPKGQVYALHSRAAGGCPALDWHILVEANGILAGMISWDGMKTMARATGSVNMQHRTFTMIATEMGGAARRAKIDGRLRDDGWIVANIEGPNVTCNAVVVPIYSDPPAAK
jgi:hypothetical protein